MAKLNHNGLLGNLQHRPKILLHNLNLFISALLGRMRPRYWQMTKQNGVNAWPNAAIWMRDELRSKVR